MSGLKAELLAPAGDLEKLKYALAYGADAVYAGQPQFSLRARENGFADIESIAQAMSYTQRQGKKFYLTSNILPHNNKIRSFRDSLGLYIELKPDALIMSDPGMIHWVRKNFPQQEIHLSVQANCNNWSTAQFWYEMGVKRIILSRELNMREIREIRAQVPEVELEVFVHGAICMAHSGRCLLSNYMSYRDSNQGMCSNACRLKYGLYVNNTPQSEDYIPLEGTFYLKAAEDNGSILRGDASAGYMLIDEDAYGTYIMNSKDMCALDHIQELMEIGICSFKIEGRTKSLFYLSEVVAAYRGALDDIAVGDPIHAVRRQKIDRVESRGTMPGFSQPLRDSDSLPQNYTSTRVAGTGGKVAAFIRSYDRESKSATISVRGQIKTGDLLECVSPDETTRIEAQNLINPLGKPVPKIDSGLENCKIFLPEDPGPFSYLVNLTPALQVEGFKTSP